jgi:hypothetical protein
MYAIFERDQINASKSMAREAVMSDQTKRYEREFQRQLTHTCIYPSQNRGLPELAQFKRHDKQKTKQSSLVSSTNAYCVVPVNRRIYKVDKTMSAVMYRAPVRSVPEQGRQKIRTPILVKNTRSKKSGI